MDESIQQELERVKKTSRRAKQKDLRNKWFWSPWRILPSLIMAYIITAVYLWAVNTPDAWLRAIGPVLTVATYLTMRPLIKRLWFAWMRQKLKDSRSSEELL